MKKKLIRKGLIIGGLAGAIGLIIVLYIMFAPHRDVQSSPIDYTLTASTLVKESLDDAKATNKKYLSEDGDSKIIAISGKVASIKADFEDNKVVLLKEDNDKAGVQCTFMKTTNKNAATLSIGQEVIVKGVYRVAATYDEDFEEYENVIVEECDIIKEK